MTQREQFEAWALKQPRGFDMRASTKNNGKYRNAMTDSAWAAWQAALDRKNKGPVYTDEFGRIIE